MFKKFRKSQKVLYSKKFNLPGWYGFSIMPIPEKNKSSFVLHDAQMPGEAETDKKFTIS